MLDDKTKKKVDRYSIDKNDPNEINYIVRKCGVSKEDIIRAIDKVGKSRKKVYEELGCC